MLYGEGAQRSDARLGPVSRPEIALQSRTAHAS